MNYSGIISNIRIELESYILANNIKSLVIGISGGIDSCLCAALAKPVCQSLNIPLIGRSLPTYTNKNDEIERAETTGKYLCTDFKEENLNELFRIARMHVYEDKFADNAFIDPEIINIREGNIKARIRMIYLYNLASKYNGMVLSTDNYTEYLLGFWTLHGDVGDYGMIQELWKSEVYDIAEWMCEHEYNYGPLELYKNIKGTIGALATDGLGVTDLGDLGQILPEWRGNSRDGYKEVDRILKVWITKDELEPIQKQIIHDGYINHPVVQRHLRSEFKRKLPITAYIRNAFSFSIKLSFR